MRLQGEPDEPLDVQAAIERPKPDVIATDDDSMVEVGPGEAWAIGITTIVTLMLAVGDAIRDDWSIAGKLAGGAALLGVWGIIIGLIIWGNE
jgi:hypothetical protein